MTAKLGPFTFGTKFVFLVSWTLLTPFLFVLIAYWLWVFRLHEGQFGFRGRKTPTTVAFSVCWLCWMLSLVFGFWLHFYSVADNKDPKSVALFALNNCLMAVSFIVSSFLVALRVWLIFFELQLAAADDDKQWISLITKPVAFIPWVVVKPQPMEQPSVVAVSHKKADLKIESDEMRKSALAGPRSALNANTFIITEDSPVPLKLLSRYTSEYNCSTEDIHQSSAGEIIHQSSTDEKEKEIQQRTTDEIERGNTDSVESVFDQRRAASSSFGRRRFRPRAKADAAGIGFGSIGTRRVTSKFAALIGGPVVHSVHLTRRQSTRMRETLALSRYGITIQPPLAEDLEENNTPATDSFVDKLKRKSFRKRTKTSDTLEDTCGVCIGSVQSAQKHSCANCDVGNDNEEESELNWFFENKTTFGNSVWLLTRATPPGVLLLAAMLVTVSVPKLAIFGDVIMCIWALALCCFVCALAYHFPKYRDSLRIGEELYLMSVAATGILLVYLLFSVAWALHFKGFWLSFAFNTLLMGFATAFVLVQTLWVLRHFSADYSLAKGSSLRNATWNSITGFAFSRNTASTYVTVGSKTTSPRSVQSPQSTSSQLSPRFPTQTGTRTSQSPKTQTTPVQRDTGTGMTLKVSVTKVEAQAKGQRESQGKSSVSTTATISSSADDYVTVSRSASGGYEDAQGKGEAEAKERDSSSAQHSVLEEETSDISSTSAKCWSLCCGYCKRAANRDTEDGSAKRSSVLRSISHSVSGHHSADKTKRKLRQLTLKEILQDEKGFRLFIRYLFSEFSYENLLCIVELTQFKLLFKEARMSVSEEASSEEPRESYPRDSEVSAPPSTRSLLDVMGLGIARKSAELSLRSLASALTTTSSMRLSKGRAEADFFQFPESVGKVHSSIVWSEQLTVEQKFLVLVLKYVANNAEMSVNISYAVRRRVQDIADFLSTGEDPRIERVAKARAKRFQRTILTLSVATASDETRDPWEKYAVTENVFDGVINALAKLMKDSLCRFICTDEYKSLERDWHCRQQQAHD